MFSEGTRTMQNVVTVPLSWTGTTSVVSTPQRCVSEDVPILVEIHGGPGNDRIFAGSRNAIVYGDEGDD